MARDESIGSDASTDRRTFVKRSAAASVGLGVALDRGEDSPSDVQEPEQDGPIEYHNFVVPNRGLIEADFVNKFLFTTGFRRRIDDNPFEECFANAEDEVERQFEDGAFVYDGVLVDATEGFQLFGDDEAVERLRDVLGGRGIDLPKMLDEGVGALVATYVFTPVAAGRLPTPEGYRSVGGERCRDDYIRLRVHELPSEVTGTTDQD